MRIVARPTPLVFPIPTSPTWNFTITVSGQTCLHYQDVGVGFSLTVGNNTFTEGVSGSLGINVTCPGGMS